MARAHSGRASARRRTAGCTERARDDDEATQRRRRAKSPPADAARPLGGPAQRRARVSLYRDVAWGFLSA